MSRSYMYGFNNHLVSEAAPGTIPVGMNSPQRAPHGLYAEQFSATAFTAPNHENQRSWLYRILPSVRHGDFMRLKNFNIDWTAQPSKSFDCNPQRWSPFQSDPSKPCDFIGGVKTLATCGGPIERTGSSVGIYAFSKSMQAEALCNADGDMLLVPQEGSLSVRTEFGVLDVEPQEIVNIPRGVLFSVDLTKGQIARGYFCENFGAGWQLPYRGPIGSNGLAAQRDFMYPVADFETGKTAYRIIKKYAGEFFEAHIAHSPFDVVGWHGNLAPFKYDLRRFNTIGTVSFDHPDPSIFTVLTSPSERAGTANTDFVIFPPRWMVAENTFRPPWYHRNTMSEFMGLITGEYDAKPGAGFVPGGASLHPIMCAHGPDAEAFNAASNAQLKPVKLENTMAFMFESFRNYLPTEFALQTASLQKDYPKCWDKIQSNWTKPTGH